MQYIAFASGGKDSTAMIEILIDKNKPVDEIVFVEVEKEFPQETEHRNTLIDRWSKKGYKCTVIKSDDKWDRWFYGEITRGKNKGLKRGFPLTAYSCWWTREAKIKVINNYLKTKGDVIQYVGYTINEKSHKRINIKENYLNGKINNFIYPLIDLGMTEDDCRKYCIDRGILNPLYKYFNRLGCYLCPKQNKDSLINLCKYFPKEWKELIRYCEDTYSDSFVECGGFNIKMQLEDLYKLEKAINNLENEEECIR